MTETECDPSNFLDMSEALSRPLELPMSTPLTEELTESVPPQVISNPLSNESNELLLVNFISNNYQCQCASIHNK